MFAYMRQQMVLSSMAALPTMVPQTPVANPFQLLPFMRPIHPLQLKPMMMPTNINNNIAKQRMVPTLNPSTMHAMRVKEPQPFVTSPQRPETVETVNGGFGIKNPLAKNSAVQDHLLQTMGEELIPS